MEVPKKGFRLQSRDIGLTYSQCPLDRSEIVEFLKKICPNASYGIVSMEKHKDGNTHYHAQLQFTKKKDASEKTFDIGKQHPNIQGTKGSVTWNDYVKKEKESSDWEEWGTFEVVVGQSKKKTKMANKELLEGDLKSMVDTDKISLFTLPALMNARKAYSTLEVSLKPRAIDRLPDNWAGLDLPLLTDKRRHYWLWSTGVNTGKTTFLKKLKSMFCCSTYNLREKYQKIDISSQFIVMDEFCKGNLEHFGVLDQMCDGTYPFPIKQRESIDLTNYYVIICSNWPISDVFPAHAVDKLQARFIEIDLANYSFI